MEKRQVTGRFFKVFFNQGRSYQYAAVTAPKDKDILDMPESGYVENWESISFTKKKERGAVADFVTSDICGELCSPKLKEVIETSLSSKDVPIQWLPVTITKEESGETFEYFVLYFPEICDSLDEQESIFDDWGLSMKECFSLNKIQGRSICNCRGSSSLLMSKDLRKAIMEAECTGLKFEHAIVLEEYEEENPNSEKIVNL